MHHRPLCLSLTLAAGLAAATPPLAATDGERMTIRGEFIDTWCYFSGVMGSPDAVVGSAHHTCALWCSAGGIPVGLLTETGEVFMVLKIGEDDATNGGSLQLSLASDTVVAEGTVWRRDGLNYIVVSSIVTNEGIVNHTHLDVGAVPPFAVPKP
ncbi:MAG: hypothetical protein ACK4TB_12230 [Gemmobacter sp.]